MTKQSNDKENPTGYNEVMTENKVLIFESDDNNVSFEVNMDVENDTVWLTQQQMAELFDKDRVTVTEHIQNVYSEEELFENSTCRKLRRVRKEGKRNVERNIAHYNLDVIISVGYRVKSKRGTQFRQWATKQLKSYLLEGYAINEKRLLERDMEVKTLKTGIQILSSTLKDHVKTVDEAKGLAVLLDQFDKGLTLLDDYDHESLDDKGLHDQSAEVVSEKDYRSLIKAMQTEFSSDIFGQEKDAGFKSAIGQIYQSVGDQDLYPSIEEKAATLLYLVVKNHAFVDGNKRIAAACFVYFLDRNGFEASNCISNDGLATLTLFIAASKATDMKLTIRLVISLLNR